MKFYKIFFALIFGIGLLFSNTAFASSEKFDVEATAFHHISDANVYTLNPWLTIDLPCILYDKNRGKLSMFSSGKFHRHGMHANGERIVDGYVLNGGVVMKIANPTPEMLSEEGVEIHSNDVEMFQHEEENKEISYFTHNGKRYDLVKKATLDAGVFGGAFTSFWDFSLTKNVVSMLLMCILLVVVFLGVARSYKNGVGKAPSGVQGFFEPMIIFIQDEVAKPFLGKKWKKFLPFLLTIFFFILALNLFGQIPFFGGSNVTGNLSVTFVLAMAAFFVVNFTGNSHYWGHVFWMPGVPAWLKIILTPVEILGVFIKPVTLMLRLFANITAGHMVMVIFVSLIFIAKDAAGDGIAWATSIGSVLLTLFMMSIELLVAFIQAFVFTILTAAYLSASNEEAHDHGEAAAH